MSSCLSKLQKGLIFSSVHHLVRTIGSQQEYFSSLTTMKISPFININALAIIPSSPIIDAMSSGQNNIDLTPTSDCTSTMKISRQGDTFRRLTPGRLCSPGGLLLCSYCLLLGNSFGLVILLVTLHYLPINNRRTQNGWTITRQDLVLLTETRAMPRSSAIGVARAWAHLVYHQLVQRGRSTTLQ